MMGELFANADAVFALTRAGTPRQRAPGGGRKPEGPEPAEQASYRLYPSQHAWLKAQPGGGSAKLRELVRLAMENG